MKNLIVFLVASLILVAASEAHPLGVFSTNTYSRLSIDAKNIEVRYVVDIAEIPSLREIDLMDTDHNNVIDDSERSIYLETKIKELASGIHLFLNQNEKSLTVNESEISFTPGQGDLKTIRLSMRFVADMGTTDKTQALHYVDDNFKESRGWKEIVIQAGNNVVIEKSSVSDKDITNELRSYPAAMLEHPVHVFEADASFTQGQSRSVEASTLETVSQKAGDGFAELISTKDLSLPVMLLSLMIAFALGAGHALTPGHGKTIVAAYLVGSRGTTKHAAFLGFTVTATHTLGVFVMGLIALFASKYILPETLFPWLSLISGLIVVGIGASLFAKRFTAARSDDSEHEHNHNHSHAHGSHSHLPPDTDGSRITWKNLLALGISGGLLPCPSAVVVLLSAIAIGRIGFGLALIVAFSLGLASVLTSIGMLMVHARHYFERFNTRAGVIRWMPVMSAGIVTIAGGIISFEAIGQMGINLSQALASFSGIGAFPIMGLGFILGLKHALDADHLVAVSTIVSERKGFFSSSIVGAMWGIGHTASLLIVGILVIALEITIPERIAHWMEFGVALMLVILGFNVLRKLATGGKLHTHTHEHSNHVHVHPHVHERADEAEEHSHHSVSRLFSFEHFKSHLAGGKRSIFIGMVHGLAGSAALMLIVLATIPTPALAFAYIAVFGLGSVGGMFLMSALIGLPFVLSARKAGTFHLAIQGLAGIVSVLFGFFLAWQIGIVNQLFIQ